MSTNWRFLIIEDKEEQIAALREALPTCATGPDSVSIDVESKFSRALDRMKRSSYDFLILDLKDDSDTAVAADENPAGVKLFEELKRLRFVPVIFYTALPKKARSLETTFVRVVEKTDGVTRVCEEVKTLLGTGLPALQQRIEELQRSYMWDFVSAQWQSLGSKHQQGDLAYLLARRLALSLQIEARKLAQHLGGQTLDMPGESTAHPMEMYEPPPYKEGLMTGNILSGTIAGVDSTWIVLTPACDFEQAGRLHRVLLAECLPLTGEQEYLKWLENNAQGKDALVSLMRDSRQKAQSGRFKFLPGTMFNPDLVIDFQRLQAAPFDQVSALKMVAALDSPYAEALLARFAQYYGRLGTPDIDRTVMMARLAAAINTGSGQNG